MLPALDLFEDGGNPKDLGGGHASSAFSGHASVVRATTSTTIHTNAHRAMMGNS
jgi:hypothetical protein